MLRILLTILLCCNLIGCGHMSWLSNRNVSQLSNENAERYLQMAATASGNERTTYQIQAAESFLANNDLERTQQLLRNVDWQTLTSEQQAQLSLIKTQLNFAKHQSLTALQIAKQINVNYLDTSQQTIYRQTLANIYEQTNNPVQCIVQRIALDKLLTDENARKSNQQSIWQTLQKMPSSVINHYLAQQTISNDLRGWLELAALNQNAINQTMFLQQLQNWRNQYPEHAANQLIPSTIDVDALPTPQQITLLLPLKGKYAKSGEAVRNGFLAAYYAARTHNQTKVTIKVIDTTSGNISELYDQAIRQGADFVVGPLTKENVQTLTDSGSLAVPTVALNTLDDYQQYSVTGLYQFGLSPLDEVHQIADRAWQNGYKNIALITPDNNWGQGITEAMQHDWENYGGNVLTNLAYQNNATMRDQIQQLLNVDQSQNRAQVIQETVKEDFKFVPRRRQDLDMLFIASPAADARQITPLLKYYFAGNIPIYATSNIYLGIPNPHLDHDLNSIIFCDMPWAIVSPDALPNNLQQVRQQIVKSWPKSYYRNSKLYALGVDAFNLATQLNRLLIAPNLGLNSATGTLYLDDHQHIYRHLLWAQIKNGKPKPL